MKGVLPQKPPTLANVNYTCRDLYKTQQLSSASIRKKRRHLPRTCGQRCAKKKKGLGGGVFFFSQCSAPAPAPKQLGGLSPRRPHRPHRTQAHARAHARSRTARTRTQRMTLRQV